MWDCITSTPLSLSITQVPNPDLSTLKRFRTVNTLGSRNGGLKILTTKASKNSPESYGELGFKEKEKENLELKSRMQSDKETDLGILEVKKRVKEEDDDGDDLVRVSDRNEEMGLRRGKQVIRRSVILAKQVISIQSALSLGFVSQIWVDVASWIVLVVEVRPNLLSGESERFLLDDVRRVGDVVLLEDENVLENEFKMVGLETLVGYNVVTPGRRQIGKVRGYSFNINSGAVELLELDPFGISIIPSSLVSTYALPVEDVLEVFSDTVIVHEAAASRVQRLTKGFWDRQNVGTSIDEYSDGEFSVGPDHGRSSRSSRKQKFRPKVRHSEDDWELPMDYL